MKKISPVIERVIIYAVIALLLGMLSPFDTGGGYFFESRAAFYLVAILLGSAFGLACVWGKADLRLTGLEPIFGPFFLAGLFSLYHLFNLRAGLDSLLLYLSYFIIFFLAANLIKDETYLKASFISLTAAGTILSLYGIYQYLFGFKELEEFAAAQQLDILLPNRVFAVFTSPNVFAGLLVMLLPLALFLFWTSSPTVSKILSGSAVLVMMAAFLLTGSRGGLLALLIVLAILLAGFIKRKELRWLAVNLAFFATLAGLFDLLLNRLAGKLVANVAIHQPLIFAEAVTSFEGRLHLWRGTLDMIKSYPIIGSGLGTFAGLYPNFQNSGIYSKFAHNTYLQLLAETGLIGGLLFLSLVVCLWLKPLKGFYVSLKDDRQLALLVLLSALTASIFRNLIDYDWSIAAVGLVFWFLAGLAFSPVLDSPASKKRSVSLEAWTKGKKIMASLVISILGMGLVLLVSSSLIGYFYRQQATEDFKSKRYAQAAESLKKAVAFDPVSAQYRHELAANYYMIWQKGGGSNWLWLQKAINSEKKAVSLERAWPGYHLQLGLFYLLSADHDASLRQLNQAEALYPNHPAYKTALGRFYLQTKDYRLAEDKLKEAIALRSLYRSMLVDGKISGRLTKLSRAEPLLAVEEAFSLLGQVYIKQGKVDKALKAYSDLIDFSSQNPNGYLGRGWIYLMIQSEYEKALADWQRAVRLEPKSFYGYYYLGITYGKLNERDKAEVALKKALKIDPRRKKEVDAELDKLQQEGCD